MRKYYRKRKEKKRKEIQSLQEIEIETADQSEDNLAFMLERHQMELETAENEIDIEEMEIFDDLLEKFESENHDNFDQTFKENLNDNVSPAVAAALFKVNSVLMNLTYNITSRYNFIIYKGIYQLKISGIQPKNAKSTQ